MDSSNYKGLQSLQSADFMPICIQCSWFHLENSTCDMLTIMQCLPYKKEMFWVVHFVLYTFPHTNGTLAVLSYQESAVECNCGVNLGFEHLFDLVGLTNVCAHVKKLLRFLALIQLSYRGPHRYHRFAFSHQWLVDGTGRR